MVLVEMYHCIIAGHICLAQELESETVPNDTGNAKFSAAEAIGFLDFFGPRGTNSETLKVALRKLQSDSLSLSFFFPPTPFKSSA